MDMLCTRIHSQQKIELMLSLGIRNAIVEQFYDSITEMGGNGAWIFRVSKR